MLNLEVIFKRRFEVVEAIVYRFSFIGLVSEVRERIVKLTRRGVYDERERVVAFVEERFVCSALCRKRKVARKARAFCDILGNALNVLGVTLRFF